MVCVRTDCVCVCVCVECADDSYYGVDRHKQSLVLSENDSNTMFGRRGTGGRRAALVEETYAVMVHGMTYAGSQFMEQCSVVFETLDCDLYVDRHRQMLHMGHYLRCYERVLCVCTDDRVIPALSWIKSPLCKYLENTQEHSVHVMWFAYQPVVQYPRVCGACGACVMVYGIYNHF